MPKAKGKVERINRLDDSSYRSELLPDLPTVAAPDLSLEFASAAGLESQAHDVQAPAVSDLDACLALVKLTSQSDYKASSVGWSSAEKRKEMCLPDMRYLLVRTELDKAVKGFISFMVTYEDGYEVIYVYEIHLLDALRGTGLGSKLMAMVEDVGRKAGLTKVMLTVFTNNRSAVKFYQRLKYELDEFSPRPRTLRGGVVKEPEYKILSKALI